MREWLHFSFYEVAQVMLTRTLKWSWLKAWAMNVAKRRGKLSTAVPRAA
jgi:transposase